jgi:hypothetical protein
MDDAFPLVDKGKLSFCWIIVVVQKFEERNVLSKSKGNEHEHRLVRFFVHNLRCTKMISWFSLR